MHTCVIRLLWVPTALWVCLPAHLDCKPEGLLQLVSRVQWLGTPGAEGSVPLRDEPRLYGAAL